MEAIWITAAKYLKDHQLELTFSTGETGTVNLQEHLNKPVFSPLKDTDYFKNFILNSWTISWENGADFAPEFLYDLAKSASQDQPDESASKPAA